MIMAMDCTTSGTRGGTGTTVGQKDITNESLRRALGRSIRGKWSCNGTVATTRSTHGESRPQTNAVGGHLTTSTEAKRAAAPKVEKMFSCLAYGPIQVARWALRNSKCGRVTD